MAKKDKNKKAKLSKIRMKKKLVKKIKTKKQPPVPKPDSVSESQKPVKLPRLLEPYTKDQLVSLIVDSAVNNPSLHEHIREVVDRDVTHRKIFVHGLAWDATRQTLVSAFEPFGEIEDCNVVTDWATGNTKGYGFVLFKTRKGASKALREPQKRIGNRMTSCQLASFGSAAKDPNAGAAASDKKNGRTVDPNVMNQGQAVPGQLPGRQGPVQPIQPQVLAAVAAAQNMDLFSQHPGLKPIYSGLLMSPTSAGYISSAVAEALSNSSLGLGCSGFGQGMIATSQLSSGTSGISLLGPYGTYGSLINAASQQAQAIASQIGQQFVSSRNKGAAVGSLSGYTSYLWEGAMIQPHLDKVNSDESRILVEELKNQGWMTINTDAAFASGKTCLAGISKNSQGTQLTWFLNSNAASPTHAEAKAIILALSVASLYGWRRILVLSDSLNLVNAINGIRDSTRESMVQVNYIKSLSESFDGVKFIWISRTENKEADEIGKIGMGTQKEGLCAFENFPFVLDV